MPMPALHARQGRQAQPARQRQLLRSPPPHSIRRNSRTIQRRKDPRGFDSIDRWHLMRGRPASGISTGACTPVWCSSGRRLCSSPSSSRSGSYCSISDHTATQRSRNGSLLSCLWCLYMPLNLLQFFSDNFAVAFRVLLGL
uniref:Uncharacterized protein n=1 Tax=Oryza glumipatula TaxID=40148 RepID=A0A0D9Z8Q7_9ORYZ